MTMIALLLFVIFKAANSQMTDCMSPYLQWTGATCIGGQANPCVNSKCMFSLAKYTYICCAASTTVVQPICPATMTPVMGQIMQCLPAKTNACPYKSTCQLSSVAGTYMCCVGSTTGVPPVPTPTTSAWINAGLSPAFVPTAPPTNLIITFGTTSLAFGQNTASPSVVGAIPMPPTSVTGFATNTAMRYSLLVVDIDAAANGLIYMILNAPGTGTNVQSFVGIPVAPSMAINPATFTGSHRIVALLFQHSAIAMPVIPNISAFTIGGFISGNSASFGNPVAGTYFTVTGTGGR